MPAPRTIKPSSTSARATADCKSDSACITILSALINDPRRRWVGQPQTAAEYANGTRFFAYRALRRRLNCRELGAATRDLTLAAGRLRTPGSGVSTAQAANALALSTAVGAELESELAGRCRASPAHTQPRGLDAA